MLLRGEVVNKDITHYPSRSGHSEEKEPCPPHQILTYQKDSYLYANQDSQEEIRSLNPHHHELAHDHLSSYRSSDQSCWNDLFSAVLLTDFWKKWWKLRSHKELWNSLSQQLGFSPRKMFFLLYLWITLEKQQGLLCNKRIHTGNCRHSKETEVSSGQSWGWELLYWFDTSAWREEMALGQQLCVQGQCYQSGAELQLRHYRSDNDIWCCIVWHQLSLDLWDHSQMIRDLYKSEYLQNQQKRFIVTETSPENIEHQRLCPSS